MFKIISNKVSHLGHKKENQRLLGVDSRKSKDFMDSLIFVCSLIFVKG